MTKRVAAISIDDLRKDVEEGGGVPQLDLENLLQTCHKMPDLVKEKILYEWIKKHLMCFITLDALQKVSRQLPKVEQDELDEKWAMKRAEKRLKDTNLSTVHTHLPKAVKVYRCSPSPKGTYDPATFYYHFHGPLCKCGTCDLDEERGYSTVTYLTRYKRMKNGGLDDEVYKNMYWSGSSTYKA
ncbi:hypothetical protein AWC38_SpisGene19706 [Stylophora pistillata]|uniref:Uncharacterized protein n=1 Tax=Stylophora pistillata TaxID=50429 RepID=A0A2B4RI33_STYPI|nr:hypothetical protein AWC38_SpisGene19706 [Stylophora pistillata]